MCSRPQCLSGRCVLLSNATDPLHEPARELWQLLAADEESSILYATVCCIWHITQSNALIFTSPSVLQMFVMQVATKPVPADSSTACISV